MKNCIGLLALIFGLANSVCGENVLGTLDFEEDVKPGFVWKNQLGQVWFAPAEQFKLDLFGSNAHSGKGALGIIGGKDLILDAKGFLEGGKTYTLSAWVKPEKMYQTFSLNFIWFGQDGKVVQRDLKPMKLKDTAWQQVSVDGKAPADFSHVYLLLNLNSSDPNAKAFIDDLSIREKAAE